MVMETDLDLNGHKILNSNLKNNFMLLGRFRRTSGDDINILFDNFFNEIILPIRCKLIEAYSQITTKTSFPQLTLHIKNQNAKWD